MAKSTSRWGIPYPELTDAPDVPADMKALAESLDDVAKDDSGTLAERPTSSAESPGKVGRYYYATDKHILYRDTGTGWIAVGGQTRVATAAVELSSGEVKEVTLTWQADGVNSPMPNSSYYWSYSKRTVSSSDEPALFWAIAKNTNGIVGYAKGIDSSKTVTVIEAVATYA